ncbi:MAG: AMP-binding protein [Pseudomonadales bacterium]
MSTVFDEFERTHQQAADRPFLHIPAIAAKAYSSQAIDLSYGEAYSKVSSCRDLYSAHGIRRGQRVALLLENRAEFFIHWLALNGVGASVVPINGEMPAEEIRYFLEHSESVAVVSIPEKVELLEQSVAGISKPPSIVSVENMERLPDFGAQSEGGKPDASTECALLYTSGSTGKPKACILSNEYFTAFGDWYRDLDGLGRIEWGKERLLTPLPLGHMNAMAVSSTAMIMNAGCIVQLDRFHPSSWWQTVRNSKATMLHYLGVLPAILLQLPDDEADDFSDQIKFGFGAGVNPKHHAPFEQRFGFPLIESWAMTECGAGGCITANKEPRHVGTSCFGKPDASVEYQLIDEQGHVVAPGEQGELRVRAAGPNPRRAFFSGYFKNPEATEEVWQDGWLNTGDVARQSEDGSLHFVDRRKNVIRRSGENIAALEVEAALSLNPAIAEALVSAVPDEMRGDEVAACVIPVEGQAGGEALANTIVRDCLERLAYFKVPGYVMFVDELPKTASNKPKRADVKKLAREGVAAGQAFDTRALKKR